MINSNTQMKGESISSKGIRSTDNTDSTGSKPQNMKTIKKKYPNYAFKLVCTIGK